jgi:hypothetical protein
MRRRLIVAIALALCACEDRSYRDIGAQIGVLVQRTDALVPPALERLASFGRRALPQIETALHTAPPAGKLHLVRALDRIGDPEAIPILRHFAVYDPGADVRSACEAVLQRWAGRGDARAREALARIADKRGRGEGPVVVGQAR